MNAHAPTLDGRGFALGPTRERTRPRKLELPLVALLALAVLFAPAILLGAAFQPVWGPRG